MGSPHAGRIHEKILVWPPDRVGLAGWFASPFLDGDSDDLTDSGVVLEYDPPRLLAYTFQNEFDPEARKLGSSRVTFTLQPYEGMVKLTVVHNDLPSEEIAAGFREGWAPILSSLKTFLESGKPLPQLRSFEEEGRARFAEGKSQG